MEKGERVYPEQLAAIFLTAAGQGVGGVVVDV